MADPCRRSMLFCTVAIGDSPCLTGRDGFLPYTWGAGPSSRVPPPSSGPALLCRWHWSRS